MKKQRSIEEDDKWAQAAEGWVMILMLLPVVKTENKIVKFVETTERFALVAALYMYLFCRGCKSGVSHIRVCSCDCSTYMVPMARPSKPSSMLDMI